MVCVKKCPACDSSNSKVAVRLTEKNEERYFKFSKVKFNGLLDKWLDSIPPIILQCKNCSHCWYQFQPDDDQLKDMYNCSNSLQKQEVCSTKTAGFIKRELQSLKKLKNKKSLKFLDYGSGSGRWALAALNAGFRVTAFEPSYTRCTNDACSLRLVHLFQDISGSKFDIVNLNQVLEHTKNPFQILKNISKLCIKNTIIRITVPNILRSNEGTKIWDLWPFDGVSIHSMAPFEHLHGFTPKSLDHLLKRAGFRSIKIFPLLRFWPKQLIGAILSRLKPSLGTTSRIVELRRKKS